MLAVAFAAAPTARAAAWTKPWFCHDLECPEFELVENLTSIGVELRRYAPSTWVETVVENATSTAPVPAAAGGGMPPAGGFGGFGGPGAAAAMPGSADPNAGTGYERAVAIGFYKLFRYISGENLASRKIDMTAPVRVTISANDGPACNTSFTIAFFVAEKNPPPPTDATVKIAQSPETTVYVNSFGGWATGATYVDRARSVASALEGAGRKIDNAYFATAGYDSPFRLTGRHNEVWLPARVEAGGAAKKTAPKKTAPMKMAPMAAKNAAVAAKPAAAVVAAKPAAAAAAATKTKPSAALLLPTAAAAAAAAKN